MLPSYSSSYEIETRRIVSRLLARVLQVSDSYEQHKELKYKPFLGIQLELIKRLIATESDIRAQKQAQDQERLEETRKRRRLLKLLGSTVAWVLLEYDRPYIRAFSHGHDSGFISGKSGLRLETLALRAAFSKSGYAGILHDITSCLRIGDLSVVDPERFVRTIELKMVKKIRRMGGRDHRQFKRGRDIREYYDLGESTKIIPGMHAIRQIVRTRDRHNWKQLRQAIEKTTKEGSAMKVVENCLIYFAFKVNLNEEVIERSLENIVTRFEKNSDTVAGFLSKQVEFPEILPLTCFGLPMRYKEKLLFGDIDVCIVVDLRGLAEALTRHGLFSSVLRDRHKGFLQVKASGPLSRSPMVLKEGLIMRLLYECASVNTIIGYVREVSKRAKELTAKEDQRL